MSDLSPKARYRLIGFFCALVLLLGLFAGVRVYRLAAAVGRADTFNRVKSVLVRQLNVPAEKINPDARLAGDLGVDGPERDQLTQALEGEFGGSFSDEELSRLQTVNDLVLLVEKRQKDRIKNPDMIKGVSMT